MTGKQLYAAVVTHVDFQFSKINQKVVYVNNRHWKDAFIAFLKADDKPYDWSKDEEEIIPWIHDAPDDIEEAFNSYMYDGLDAATVVWCP